MARIMIEVDDVTHYMFKEYALKHRKSMKSLILDCIKMYIGNKRCKS